jgi:hypothetical protein
MSLRRTCLYVKCRPQNADIFELCRKVRRVFIGYPPCSLGGKYDRTASRAWLLDVGAEAWDPSQLLNVRRGYRAKITANRNLARTIAHGSIVVVPRPSSGSLFLARIARFELVEAPTWVDDYLDLRREAGLEVEPEAGHVGDVVQSWPLLTDFVQVPFAAAPRWFASQLLSRTTVGIVKDGPSSEPKAMDVAEGLLEGSFTLDWSPTTDVAQVRARMLRALGPPGFEQLVCELLQLEADPGVRWVHVGGSGDGGADGLAFDASGKPCGGLTCKTWLGTDPAKLGGDLQQRMTSAWNRPIDAHVAWLSGWSAPMASAGSVRFLDGAEVARLLIRHRTKCVFATMLGLESS